MSATVEAQHNLGVDLATYDATFTAPPAVPLAPCVGAGLASIVGALGVGALRRRRAEARPT